MKTEKAGLQTLGSGDQKETCETRGLTLPQCSLGPRKLLSQHGNGIDEGTHRDSHQQPHLWSTSNDDTASKGSGWPLSPFVPLERMKEKHSLS